MSNYDDMTNVSAPLSELREELEVLRERFDRVIGRGQTPRAADIAEMDEIAFAHEFVQKSMATVTTARKKVIETLHLIEAIKKHPDYWADRESIAYESLSAAYDYALNQTEWEFEQLNSPLYRQVVRSNRHDEQEMVQEAKALDGVIKLLDHETEIFIDAMQPRIEGRVVSFPGVVSNRRRKIQISLHDMAVSHDALIDLAQNQTDTAIAFIDQSLTMLIHQKEVVVPGLDIALTPNKHELGRLFFRAAKQLDDIERARETTLNEQTAFPLIRPFPLDYHL